MQILPPLRRSVRNLRILPSELQTSRFGENTVEKRENAGYDILFLIFSKIKCHDFKVFWFINPFPNKPWILRVCTLSLLKTLKDKEKLLVTSNFSFSYSVFYHCREHSAIFIKYQIVICKPFQFGRV